MEQPPDSPDEGSSQAPQKESAKTSVSKCQARKKKPTYPDATLAQGQSLNPPAAHANLRPPEHVSLPYNGNENGPNMSRWHDIKDTGQMKHNVTITQPRLHWSTEQFPPRRTTFFSRVIEFSSQWVFAFSKNARDVDSVSKQSYKKSWPTKSSNRVAFVAPKTDFSLTAEEAETVRTTLLDYLTQCADIERLDPVYKDTLLSVAILESLPEKAPRTGPGAGVKNTPVAAVENVPGSRGSCPAITDLRQRLEKAEALIVDLEQRFRATAQEVSTTKTFVADLEQRLRTTTQEASTAKTLADDLEQRLQVAETTALKASHAAQDSKPAAGAAHDEVIRLREQLHRRGEEAKRATEAETAKEMAVINAEEAALKARREAEEAALKARREGEEAVLQARRQALQHKRDQMKGAGNTR